MQLRRDVTRTVPITVLPIGRVRETCIGKAAKLNRPAVIINRVALAAHTNEQPPDRMKTKKSFVRRIVDLVDWIVPGAILALIPKCPMCLAAYIAAWTGIGLSFTAATYLRTALLVLCAGLLLFFSVRTNEIMF